MKRYFQRAIKDLFDNRFLTFITVVTIALAILIASAFALFFVNAGEVLNLWQKGIRMMVYLKKETSEAARLDTKYRLQHIAGIQDAQFISKTEGMHRLKEQMAHHSALLENLKENPLPDAFEVKVSAATRTSDELQFLAERIQALPAVAEVEYGRQWIQRFTSIIHLFSLAGYAVGTLFFIGTILIVANTIRLVLYSRREEIETMRLVGATDRFIEIPFYIEGMVQGGVGTAAGLMILFAGYLTLASQFDTGSGLITVRFFAMVDCLVAVLGGVAVGCLGSWISLKQFMKA
ncbi:MAG: ABC transporter permease [Desulfatitalea sp.]|nr:permease-like cell division protein FtsX [Desulfatitalea sp.]NNK02795.1 ABC transporter permease [Desulfatitalea sp.]